MLGRGTGVSEELLEKLKPISEMDDLILNEQALNQYSGRIFLR
jgi:hypothetical protein